MICFADSADQLAHFLTMGQVGKLESSIKDNRRILGDGGGQDLHFPLILVPEGTGSLSPWQFVTGDQCSGTTHHSESGGKLWSCTAVKSFRTLGICGRLADW